MIDTREDVSAPASHAAGRRRAAKVSATREIKSNKNMAKKCLHS